MINQLNGSRSNERNDFWSGVWSYGKHRRGLSTYFKFGIVMVAALMALVV